jgi:hypothetical protein
MSAKSSTVELYLELGDLPPEPAESALGYLIEEIDAMGEVRVTRKESARPPSGARTGSAVELGALLIALGGAGATLPALIALLQAWLQRRNAGEIRLKIGDDELVITGGVPDETRRQIVDAFLRRHES